jgi:F5/8 type C domain/Secretion system C-terminal sorting domain
MKNSTICIKMFNDCHLRQRHVSSFRNTVILFLLLSSFMAISQANLAVNYGSVVQSNFLGVNGVHNGSVYMDCQTLNGMTAANRAIVYDRLARMGVRVVRTVYSPWYAARGNWNGTYDWNSREMNQFYNWAQDMKDRNIDVALSLGFYFPADTYNWKSGINGDVTGNLNRIADWASQSVYQMVTVKGLTNVKYGFLFTEPNTTVHDEVGGPPSGYTNWTYYKAVVNAIHNKLTSDGRRSLIKLVGPNNTTDGAFSATAASELNNAIDIYAGHEYSKADYAGWLAMANKIKNDVSSTGKPFWIDEYGLQDKTSRDGAGYGNYIAQATNAFINSGAQTSMLWQISEDRFPSAAFPTDPNNDNGFFMDYGSARYVPTSKLPYPSWYALSLMTKYMGGAGTTVYGTTNNNGVYISATKQSDGNYSFLVTNGNNSTQNISINLSSSIGGKTLYRYLYDPSTIVPDDNATMIGYSKTLPNITNSITDDIPGQGVVIYSTIQGNQLVAGGGGNSSNLAVGSTVSASSTDFNNGYSAAKAIDGNKANFAGWASGAGVPQWFLVDFGSSKTYNKVVLNSTTGYLLKDYDIESWNGTSYVTVAQVRNNVSKEATTTFTATTSSRLRINCITGDQFALARIDELEIYAPNTNLASGATVSASSTDFNNGYSPAKAIDGNKGDFAGWASGAGVPQWFLLDFGSDKTFNKVVLNTTTGYLLEDYDIESWNGSAYVMVAQVRNNTVKEVSTTFTAVTSSRLRINCITGDQFSLARIDEIEVQSSDDTTPPPTPTGNNIATSATTSASSTDTGNSYSTAKAIDGNKGDFAGWASDAGVPQWFLLDFGSNKAFNRVVLNTSTGYLLKDYDIESWNGSSYVMIAQVRNNTVKEVTTTFSEVTSSRLRINCLGGDVWGYARIDEIEVYSSATTTPPASTPPTASASSTDTGNGYSPAKAIDGNKGDFAGWSSNPGVPQWLLLDYGVNKTFDKVVLNTTTGYLLKSYDVEYWNGSSYVAVAQVRNNTVKEVISTFPAVTSPRVRINCIAGDQWNYARIDELQVLNGNSSLRKATIESKTENSYSSSEPSNGVFQWKNDGWVKYITNNKVENNLASNVWNISKSGNVFVYDGKLPERKQSEEISEKTTFTIFPNPSSEVITLLFSTNTTQDVTITFTDSRGLKIREVNKSLESAGDQSVELNIKDLKVGIYYLQLTADGTTGNAKKLIVVK